MSMWKGSLAQRTASLTAVLMSEADPGLCVCRSWRLILAQAQTASARLGHLKCSSTDADTFSVFLSSTPYLPLRTGLTAYSSFADRFLGPSIVSLSFIFFLLIVDFIFDVKKCVHGFVILTTLNFSYIFFQLSKPILLDTQKVFDYNILGPFWPPEQFILT